MTASRLHHTVWLSPGRSALLLPLIFALLAFLTPSLAFSADADHLTITELMIKTRTPVSYFGSPFIEIHNPTASPIDLGQYYLTDAATAPSAFYYHITESDPAAWNPGGGNGGDFHARFPAGCVLAAGQSLIISLNGSDQFFEAYDRLPDFELFEDGLEPDAVPELVEAFPGAIDAGTFGGDNVPVLADVAESLVLYQWDGTSGLVQDVDYALWGTNTAVRVDKTGVVMPGGAYLDDTPVASQVPIAEDGHNFLRSFRRLSADEGTEIITGGNGLTGHDETSENLPDTWADVEAAGPAAGLAAPFPSAPIITQLFLSPSTPFEGQAVNFGAELVTYGDMDQVRFLVSVDGQPFTELPAAEMAPGQWSASFTAPTFGSQVRWYCEAVNALGGVAVSPAGAPRFFLDFTVAEAPGPEFFPHKLLITEVNAGNNAYPSMGMEDLAGEFIEIHNPNDYAVALENFYLTDAVGYLPAPTLYWQIAFEGDPIWATVGGGNYNDFTARFPAGYMIAAGQTITVSVAGSDWFQSVYGIQPDLELYEDGAEPDAIPDMRPVFVNAADDLPGDSIYTPDRPAGSDALPRGIPELEEYYGEVVVLFHWDGMSDLVTDVDFFAWGDAKTGNFRVSFDKTGVVVNGSAYQPDTPVEWQDWYIDVDLSGQSYCRTDTDEGAQPMVGGNGVDGRDETGENMSDTFTIRYPGPGYYDPDGSGPPVEGAWQDLTSGALADTLGSVAHAWADLNDDGRDDLLLVRDSAAEGSTVLANGGHWNFQPISVGSQSIGGGIDASLCDMNNDGLADLFIARSAAPNELFLAYSFYEGDYGLWPQELPTLTPQGMTRAADAIDLDQDGYLEIYVSNLDGPNQLLLSRYGFVDDVPAELEFPAGSGGFQWCDLEGDLDSDLVLVDPSGLLHVMTQTEPGQFEETTVAIFPGAVNCSVADFDNDGDADVYVANPEVLSKLYENLGPGQWQAVDDPVFDEPAATLGAVWGDFDNDGWLDLYEFRMNEPDRLLRNEGGTGQFTTVADPEFAGIWTTSCATWGDHDQDGDLDLFLSHPVGANQMLRNNLDSTNNWLTVRLKGNPAGLLSNSDAIGAVIRVELASGTQWRFVSAGTGGPGQATLDQHFGLGQEQTVERVTVWWPFLLPWGSRHTTQLENVTVNQKLVIVEDPIGVSPAPDEPETPDLPAVLALGSAHPNPFNPATTIAFELPRPVAVRLEVYDLRGRLVRTLVDGETRPAGRHEAVWNGLNNGGRPAAAGVYLVKLRAGRKVVTGRAVMVK